LVDHLGLVSCPELYSSSVPQSRRRSENPCHPFSRRQCIQATQHREGEGPGAPACLSWSC